MKKLLVLFIILTIFLSGCGIYNLSLFTLPDDTEFLALIEELDTPEKICQYMLDNFEYEKHLYYSPDPYTLWKTKKGDCNDYSVFAIFVANYHNYKTYQIHIFFKGTFIKHMLAIYLENDKYTYSNNKAYYPINVSTLKEVVEHYFDMVKEYELNYYTIYDYNMNIIEQVIE